MPSEQVLVFTVSEDVGAMRLDVWLQRQMPDHSRVFVQRLVRDGFVTIETQNPKSKIQNPKLNHRVVPGHVVTVTVPPAEASEVTPEDIPLDVLYEDEDLIVINKPPGLVVHPALGHFEHTLVNALLHHCAGELSGIGGVQRPGIVHRLDQDTSGCLVCAKNDAAHHALAEQFKSREVNKAYLALVWGVPRLKRGRIEGAIGRSPVHRKRMAILADGGREAMTDYEVQREFGDASLLRCVLHTGRTHQIRVHLASMGHPIIGDGVYGRTKPYPLAEDIHRQMLHAQVLAFNHPHTHKRLEFSAPIPQDMAMFLQRLESKAKAES